MSTGLRTHFPAQGSAALSPARYPDLQQYAGRQVTDGDQAKAYATAPVPAAQGQPTCSRASSPR
jgi:hypothetical protein